MSDRAVYAETVGSALAATVDSFHVDARLDTGVPMAVPVPYQIQEPGFRPFRAGKASAEEIQARFDEIVADADERNIALGLESQESVRKLLLQEGLGIDCSNFAFRSMQGIHSELYLGDYAKQVVLASDRVRRLSETNPSWVPKDELGNERSLTDEELGILAAQDTVSVDWVCNVFGKDPEFITGSAQICDANVTQRVTFDELLPGDLVSFRNAAERKVSHVGVVEHMRPYREGAAVEFWHSWHTRGWDSGLRRDTIYVTGDDARDWRFSHQGLNDNSRYSGYDFLRPRALVSLVPRALASLVDSL